MHSNISRPLLSSAQHAYLLLDYPNGDFPTKFFWYSSTNRKYPRTTSDVQYNLSYRK